MTRYAYGPEEAPTIVDAVQWKDGSVQPSVSWLPDPSGDLAVASQKDTAVDANGALNIKTPEGIMRAAPGWWIVRVSGALTICAPNVFAQFYRKV